MKPRAAYALRGSSPPDLVPAVGVAAAVRRGGAVAIPVRQPGAGGGAVDADARPVHFGPRPRRGPDPSHAVGPPGVAEVRPAGGAKRLRPVARAEAVDLDDDQPGFGLFLRG